MEFELIVMMSVFGNAMSVLSLSKRSIIFLELDLPTKMAVLKID